MTIGFDTKDLYEVKIAEMKVAKILDVPKSMFSIWITYGKWIVGFSTEEDDTWANLEFNYLPIFKNISELLELFFKSSRTDWRKQHRKINPNE